MKNPSILLQIILFISGLVVTLFYVVPEFGNVNDNQNMVRQYNEAIERAEDLRDSVVDLRQQKDLIPPQTIQALNTYLPRDKVDTISIQRDILAYTVARNLVLEGLFLDERSRPIETDLPIEKYVYNISVLGTYTDIKAFIADLERNVYPLRLNALDLSADDFGFVEADLVVETYRFSGLLNNN